MRGGDRLPWVQIGTTDNFAPLSSLDWQIHVYGEATEAFRLGVAPTGIPVHSFASRRPTERAGLTCGAAYLVRPDGHVALVTRTQDAEAFVRYLVALGVKPRAERRALALAS